MFRYLPEQASDFAPLVDDIHNLVTDLSVFFTVLIVGVMIYFAVKYRKRDGVDHETPAIEGSHVLEIIWTVVPTIICIIVGAYGYYGFKKLREVPQNEPGLVEINVTGKQWAWSFKYPNGKEVGDEFVVPVNRAVKLVLTSTDVLHSFFVPSMRTKMDAVPGHYTMEWFRPVKTGVYNVFCTEYCGTQHSTMLAKMKVVPDAEYERWVSDKGGGAKPADLGRQLYSIRACNSCHSLDGSRLVGPSFLNLYMKKARFDDGKEYTADDEYLRESILNSNKNIVEGFSKPSPMPSFENMLSQDDVTNLIAFIKTQKGEAKKPVQAITQDLTKLTPAERGKLSYQNKACIGCHSLDGNAVVGPTFKGLYGKQEELVDGSTMTVDDAYIKESILNSQKTIVKGYTSPSLMPPYEGQFSDQDLNDIIEFIKTVK